MFKFFSNAINELVSGPGAIKERVMVAGEHFTLMELEAVPEHLKDIARDIRRSLTEYKAKPGASFPYDSDVRVTMKKCSPQTAVDIAKKNVAPLP